MEYTFLSVEKQNSQLKGRNGFPLQATCFPVGERRIASSATASPVSLSHWSQVAIAVSLVISFIRGLIFLLSRYR
jgi:hypothetical protein